MQRARENSVRNLENLLTVLAGLALSLGILRMFSDGGSGVTMHWKALPAFIAFLATLVPFYHGGLRHLYFTYVEQEGRAVRSGGLFVDFGMLFLEGCGLVALGHTVGVGSVFPWVLVYLLAFDSAWGLLAHVGFTVDKGSKPEIRWGLINIVTVVVLVLLLLGKVGGLGSPAPSGNFVVLVVAVLRTVVDYGWTWHYYYPSE